MQVKICGLKHPANIEEILRLQPAYMGFIFYKASPRYAGDDEYLKKYVKGMSGVHKTGVFVNASSAEIFKTVDEYKLDLVQLHGDEDEAFCESINSDIPVIKAFRSALYTLKSSP